MGTAVFVDLGTGGLNLVTFRRGTGSVEVELASVQTWIETNAEPIMDEHTRQIEELCSFKSNTEGKFTIIVWLVGINVALMIALIASLFAWGLSHITLKVEALPPQAGIEVQQQHEAIIPPLRR